MLQNLPYLFRNQIWRSVIKVTENRFDKYNKIKDWEKLGANEVKTRQENLLMKNLNNAVNNIQYYRDIYREEGLVSGGSLEIDSVEELPILTKSELQENFEKLKHDSLDSFSWYENRSGGSTGEPTKFIQCKKYQYWNYATATRVNEWAGYQNGYPRIKLWGSERDVTNATEPLLSKVGKYLRNENVLNAYSMTENDMKKYVAVINRKAPVQIYAYVDAIHELARYIDENNIDIHSPTSIMTSGGTLHPHMRQKVEKVFQTDVFNRYGCREAGVIACECPTHNGLHVISPYNYVEIVDEENNPVGIGEEGRILLTTLRNPVMPLIRYEVGDIGIKGEEECTCGLHWAKIEKVLGRQGDMIQTPNGVVSPIAFSQVIGVYLEKDGVERYQIIQEDIDRFSIKIASKEPENFKTSGLKEELASMVGEITGSECEINIQLVSDIRSDSSGKYRYIKTNL